MRHFVMCYVMAQCAAAAGTAVCIGSVTLVFLPLKYEIDDSVTVTVVLITGATVVLLFML